MTAYQFLRALERVLMLVLILIAGIVGWVGVALTVHATKVLLVDPSLTNIALLMVSVIIVTMMVWCVVKLYLVEFTES